MNPKFPQFYKVQGNITVDADLEIRENLKYINDYVMKRADELAKFGDILADHIRQAVREEKASGRFGEVK
jgi:ubiquinone biosynthesis protein UbiJ